MNVNGYETFTTFWQDFSIADVFGVEAVQDTFDRVFNEWKSNYKYLTELVMVLNWKLWQYCDVNAELSRLYNELWAEADMYACNNLKDRELKYFYSTTD